MAKTTKTTKKTAAPKAKAAAKPGAKKASTKAASKKAAPAKASAKVAAKKVVTKKAAAKKPAVKPAAKKTTAKKAPAAKPAAKAAKSPAKSPAKSKANKATPAKPASKAKKPAARKSAAKPAAKPPVKLMVRPSAAKSKAPAAPTKVAANAAKAAAKPKKAPAKVKIEFSTNEYVVYPTHGVGKITGIEEQEVSGTRLQLFVIDFAQDKMTLRVPLAKAKTSGMRRLSTAKEMEQALTTLKGRARVKRTMWSRRAQEYEAKINSGDPISIAEVVRDLHRNSNQPDQSYSERQIYEAALGRLAREFAAVDKTDEEIATEKLEGVLKAA